MCIRDRLSNGGRERNEIWHKGSLGDEHDARTSNACIVQRKRTTALDDENALQHVTSILVTVLCNQPEALTFLDLDDNQSRYL